jgi:hypothetical protein
MSIPNVRPLVHAGRILPSWIAGFLEYTENIWSTESFRTWAAIAALAGALEQKVWIRSQGAKIYPNLFTFLVGPPGAGKTRPVEVTADLWSALDDHHIAPVSLTKAALMDRLGQSKRVAHTPEGELIFNSLLIASKELGALIPGYDADFLNALTYLYDNIKYDEERRGNKGEPLVIDNPQINLIGCTTPGFLLDTMPPSAWEQGFLSRVLIIYDDISSQRPLNILDEDSNVNEPLRKALKDDIRSIGARVGKMTFTPEANDLIQAWYKNKELEPAHPRLVNYVTRRPIHLLKLCMIACADRGGPNMIIAEDAEAAINWLTQAEGHMPDIFTAMASGGDAQVMSDCWHYVFTHKARSGQNTPMHLVYEFLGNRLPAHSVQRVYELMLRSRLFTGEIVDGVTLLVPRHK